MSNKPEIIQSGNLFDSTTKWKDLASQKPKYKPALFAYLDILAYKALVDLFGDAAPQQIVTIISEVIPFPESAYKTISVRVISDSILVISEDTSMVSLVNLINVVEILRMGFLKYRLMVRGAIVRDRYC